MLRAWVLVAVMRGLVLTLSLSHLRRLAMRLEGLPLRQGPPRHLPEHLAWAVTVASRFVPGATCLPQALAGKALFRLEGYAADVHVGVARTPDGQFQAHAWLESGGRVVIGHLDLDGFQPILKMEGATS